MTPPTFMVSGAPGHEPLTITVACTRWGAQAAPVRNPVAVPDALKHGLFSIQDARRAGLTSDQLRGKSYRKIARGLYVWIGFVDDQHLALRAQLRRLPTGCVFSGLTAARLYGLDFQLGGPIEVTAPEGAAVRLREDLRVRYSSVEPGDASCCFGLPVTSPVRTWFDLARHLCLTDAVAGVDWALRQGRVTRPGLAAYIERRQRLKGTRQARRVLELADPRSESLMESRLRALLLTARPSLPSLAVQHEVVSGTGQVLGRLDLAFVGIKLGIEYDGAHHVHSLAEDDQRQNRLINAGWVLLRFTAQDFYRRPEGIIAEVRALLLQRRLSRA